MYLCWVVFETKINFEPENQITLLCKMSEYCFFLQLCCQKIKIKKTRKKKKTKKVAKVESFVKRGCSFVFYFFFFFNEKKNDCSMCFTWLHCFTCKAQQSCGVTSGTQLQRSPLHISWPMLKVQPVAPRSEN